MLARVLPHMWIVVFPAFEPAAPFNVTARGNAGT